MFEPSLVAEAYAAAAGTPTSGSVDPQTLMYIIGGIVMGIVGGIGTLLYRKSPDGQGPTPTVHQPSVDVLGPYQAIFDRLGTVLLTLERVAGGHLETREATASALQTTRHDLKAVLHEMSQQIETDMEEIKRMMREKNAVLGRLDEFVRAKLK